MRVVRTVSWILTFVAIGAAAAAWFTPRVTADRAEQVALDALETAGVDGVRVPRPPTEGVHASTTVPTTATTEEPSDTTVAEDPADPTTTSGSDDVDDDATDSDDEADDDAVDVWIVRVAKGDEIIEMRVHKDEGQLVYVDDLIGRDRDQRLLTDQQWEIVQSYESGGIDPWVRRNVAGSIAAVLIVVVGFLLAKGAGVQRRADVKRDSA